MIQFIKKTNLKGGKSMSNDLKKIFWVGAAVVVLGLFLINVLTPTYNNVKKVGDEVKTIDYSSK